MEVHKIQIIIIDHDNIGIEECIDVIHNTNFPNDCISPSVFSYSTVDIGEWSDNHPLNDEDTFHIAVKRLFKK